MALTPHIASTAVVPLCPRCGRRVRSSVQLRADSIDLAARVAAALARLQGEQTLAARLAYEATALAAELELEALAAELAGSHFVCPQAPALH